MEQGQLHELLVGVTSAVGARKLASAQVQLIQFAEFVKSGLSAALQCADVSKS